MMEQAEYSGGSKYFENPLVDKVNNIIIMVIIKE